MPTAHFTKTTPFTGEGASIPIDAPDPLLLDSLAGYAVRQAYSLRQLSLDYEGHAVTVRRSSDSTTADIEFTEAGSLDTAALLAFVGGGSGFVATWYDQSGNGRHMVQATAARQPKIVDAGSLVMIGDAPGLQFLGSDCHLKHTSPGMNTLAAASGVTAVQVHTDVSNQVGYAETAPPSGGRVMPFVWSSATPPLMSAAVFNDAAASQSAGNPTFSTNATGEIHQDIFTKANGAGATRYRDGVQRSNAASWNPTMPTTLTSAVLGAYEAASFTSDYTGKIGEHILLAGVVDAASIAILTASHEEYFGI